MRADIQVLRALAVLAVVLYHFKAPASAGGFIGVDIFFVISGFLVGGALMGEIRDTGRIDLVRFLARRARRILPLAAVVITGVAVASYLVLSPLRLRLWDSAWDTSSVAKDGIASLLYVPNLWFMEQGNDYLADDSASPYLHFWSLGVEEQFYVAIPLTLLLGWMLVRRRFPALVVIVAALTAASLAFSLLAVGDEPVTAFFHPLSRFWELGAGLLAAVLVRSGRIILGPRTARVVTVMSLAALGLAVLVIDSPPVWPAPAAVVVVGLVSVLLWAGPSMGDWGEARAFRPLVLLGDRSYAVYLWHWPVYALAGLHVGRDLRAWETLVLAVGVLLLSEASYRTVESRPRRWPVATSAQLRKVFAATGTAVVVSFVALSGASLAAEAELRQGTTDISARPFAVPQPSVGPTAAGSPAPGPPAPELTSYLPANLRPPLGLLAEDIPVSYGDACHRKKAVREDPLPECVYGSGNITVALFGDSHAAQWLPALLPAAERDDIRVVSLTASSCGPFDFAAAGDSEFQGCDVWRENALSRLAEEQPDVVFTAFYANGLTLEDEIVVAGFEQGISEIRRRVPASTRLITVQDTPVWPWKPGECVARKPDDISGCMMRIDEVMRRPLLEALADQAVAQGVEVLDMRALYCTDEICGPVIGDIFAYRDHHHVTATFAEALAPLFEMTLGLRPPAGG